MRSELRGRSETARSAARGEASAPRRFGSRAALVALLVAQPALPAATASDKLPALGAPIGATSVSGLSSGAYMAGQIQLAHAKDVVGAGLVAGGPFACAESAAGKLVPYWPTAVAQNAPKSVAWLHVSGLGNARSCRARRPRQGARKRRRDRQPGRSRRRQNLSLFRQRRPHGDAAGRRSRQGALPASSASRKRTSRSSKAKDGHGFLTEEAGEACALTDKPYVNDCDYDQAKAILQWIYGSARRALSCVRRALHHFRPIRLR